MRQQHTGDSCGKIAAVSRNGFLRYSETNPVSSSIPFPQLIAMKRNDLENVIRLLGLGSHNCRFFFASDRFGQFHNCAPESVDEFLDRVGKCDVRCLSPDSARRYSEIKPQASKDIRTASMKKSGLGDKVKSMKNKISAPASKSSKKGGRKPNPIRPQKSNVSTTKKGNFELTLDHNKKIVEVNSVSAAPLLAFSRSCPSSGQPAGSSSSAPSSVSSTAAAFVPETTVETGLISRTSRNVNAVVEGGQSVSSRLRGLATSVESSLSKQREELRCLSNQVSQMNTCMINCTQIIARYRVHDDSTREALQNIQELIQEIEET